MPLHNVEKGQRFGRLVVTGHPFKSGAVWYCTFLCDCGKTKNIRADNVATGRTLSCGCLHDDICRAVLTTHGLEGTRLYRIWRHIKTRCFNSKSPYYHRYGGRGITICNEWKENFKAFHDWALSNGYEDHLQIDRTDNEGDYTPENCRWTTSKTNNRNRCDNRVLEAFGETKLLCEWADDARCIVSKPLFHTRIALHWSTERALTTPPFNRGRKTKKG